ADNLRIDQGGFSFDSLTLQADEIKVAKVLDLKGFFVTVTGFNYDSTQSSLSSTAIAIGASSVQLFPGSSGFTAGGGGFTGSYNFQTNALSLHADAIDIHLGQGLLDFEAKDASFDLNPFQITVGSASVSSAKLAGFFGNLTDLHITGDGFSVRSITIGT